MPAVGRAPTLAVETAGEAAVLDAIANALEPFRLADGGCRLENLLHCLVAEA